MYLANQKQSKSKELRRRFTLHPLEYAVSHTESCGVIWSHMESYGVMWSRMESCGTIRKKHLVFRVM